MKPVIDDHIEIKRVCDYETSSLKMTTESTVTDVLRGVIRQMLAWGYNRTSIDDAILDLAEDIDQERVDE